MITEGKINSEVTKSYDPSLFTLIKPNVKHLRNVITALRHSTNRGGRLTLPVIMKEFIKNNKEVDVRINQKGNIIMISAHKTKGLSCSITKTGNIHTINSAEALDYIESKNIETPARYRAEWNEPSKAWIGILID